MESSEPSFVCVFGSSDKLRARYIESIADKDPKVGKDHEWILEKERKLTLVTINLDKKETKFVVCNYSDDFGIGTHKFYIACIDAKDIRGSLDNMKYQLSEIHESNHYLAGSSRLRLFFCIISEDSCIIEKSYLTNVIHDFSTTGIFRITIDKRDNIFDPFYEFVLSCRYFGTTAITEYKKQMPILGRVVNYYHKSLGVYVYF